MIMQGYEVKFNIYADSADEVESLRQAIVGFISSHARQGRAVTATKLTEALSRWESNPIVKHQIINYFK